MRWILSAGAVLAAVAIAIVVIGWLLPRDHVAAVAARISAPPDSVWAALTDAAAFPAWRPGVARVDLLPPAPSGPSWREHSGGGTITYVVEAAEPPRRLVTRIASTDLPFGGTWEYQITPDTTAAGAASRVTIREHGSVYNPVFRFVSRFIMGHFATLEAYLRALGRRFGQDIAPERLPSRR